MDTTTVNISFKTDLLKQIDKTAKAESRSRSELIREAAREYIEKKSLAKIRYEYLDINPEKCEAVKGYVLERAISYGHDDGKRYTYADYLKWPEDERWEIIDGIPYNMSPAPSWRHQAISMALSVKFYNYLQDKPCEVFAAPFDVRIPEEGESDDEASTVVQPDIIVVCDKTKLDSRGCKRAPDLVVEILSPYTAQKDITKKFERYERARIREYWVIRPEEMTVMVFELGEDNKYGRPDIYSKED